MINSRILPLAFLLTVALLSCEKDKDNQAGNPPVDVHTTRLKDVIVHGLPSPYYHFVYNDSGYVTHATYSAGLREYTVDYAGGRISQVNSIHAINKDELIYQYTDGHPSLIKYVNEGGVLYKRSFISYNPAGQIGKIEWEVRQPGGGFAQLRTVEFTYHSDGNLKQLIDDRHAFNQQPAARYVTSYSGYDNKLNVDGFSKFHIDDEHLLLFPSKKFQKNNPAKEIRTGTGIHYEIDFTYTYDETGRPSVKQGQGVFTGGPNNGQSFQSTTSFTYYP